MAQHDYVIDNSTGANVRADINSVLQAIASNNSGSSNPSTTVASQFFADTNAGIMKLRNTSNNGFVNLFTLAGGIDVDAASTFSEDVTFEGASANIKFDKSDNALEFRDNMKAKFGDGDDLSIFHNGSHSIIAETGTGNLQLRCADFRVTNADYTETIIVGNTNGAVELYFDNVARLGTSSTGVTVVGVLSTTSHIKLPDNVQLQMGDAGTNDFILFHDGTDNIINCTNNGNLFQRASSIHLQSQAAENMAIGEANGAFEAYFDNSLKAETTSSGFRVTGACFVNDGSATGNRISVGNGGDLKIFHTNPGSFIQDTSLRLVISSNIVDISDTNGDKMAEFTQDSSAKLFHNGSQKLNTSSTGITVTGTVVETSDIALKSDIQPLTNTLEKIQQITGYKYNFINSISPSMGVIAQDVEKVYPELVHGSEGNKTLQYSGLIGVLVEAVKDLSAKVAALEAA